MSLSSFERTNLKSNKVRTFVQIILGLALVYLCGFITYWVLSALNISYAMGKASPLLRQSVTFLVISIIFGIIFGMLRWQILRVGLLATALLSLAYLGCAILLLVVDNSLAHIVLLLMLAVLFLFIFIYQSNILIYWRDRTYPDLMLEGLVAVIFLYFIVHMLQMAFMGGTS
jgi:hypothetical protein